MCNLTNVVENTKDKSFRFIEGKVHYLVKNIMHSKLATGTVLKFLIFKAVGATQHRLMPLYHG